MPNLSFTQTCEDVSLAAIAARHSHDVSLDVVLDSIGLVVTVAGEADLSFDQIADPVTLEFVTQKGRVMQVESGTAEAKLVATVELGEPPEHPEFLARPKIYNLTGQVRDSGGAILCFVGPPWKTIEWRVLEGHGTVTPFTTFTDKLGRCSCRYDAAGFVEHVVIGAVYVP
jgi:hypothetical protein